MKFLDLFAGIGGFRLGMEAAGHECVGFCEIDKFARKSYKAIHNTEGEIELHDITAVSDESIRGIGSVDVICGGFPCQAFSIAGNRRGFEDTRGTLFFEIARFASILRPRYLFLENVKGLLNHDGGATFETILRTLDELGYNVEWQVLNSKNFGVPQNRERVFIVGHLRGAGTRGVFPLSKSGQQATSIKEQQNITNISKSVTIEEIRNQEYNLSPARYIEHANKEVQHRSFDDISKDLNRVIDFKNAIKITINENMAKSLGLYDLALDFKAGAEISKTLSEQMKPIGIDIKTTSVMSLTRNKELKIEVKDFEHFPEIMSVFANTWKTQMMFLNNEENRLLAELKDALIPKLLNGEITLN